MVSEPDFTVSVFLYVETHWRVCMRHLSIAVPLTVIAVLACAKKDAGTDTTKAAAATAVGADT